MILQRPSDGCPEGTYDGMTTCFCEDHCSWEACRLLAPPFNCLSSMNGGAIWAWNSSKKFWFALGI